VSDPRSILKTNRGRVNESGQRNAFVKRAINVEAVTRRVLSVEGICAPKLADRPDEVLAPRLARVEQGLTEGVVDLCNPEIAMDPPRRKELDNRSC